MSMPAEEIQFDTHLSADDIKVTAKAEQKLLELLKDADSDITGIRVYVSGGGCSGMQYGMTFAEGASEFDAVLPGNGYDIYVDSVALAYLRGVEIDYVENNMQASFVFNNVFNSTGGSGVCGACGARGGGCG